MDIFDTLEVGEMVLDMIDDDIRSDGCIFYILYSIFYI